MSEPTLEELRRRHIERMGRDMMNISMPHDFGLNRFVRVTAIDPCNRPGWRARLRNAWLALKGELE